MFDPVQEIFGQTHRPGIAHAYGGDPNGSLRKELSACIAARLLEHEQRGFTRLQQMQSGSNQLVKPTGFQETDLHITHDKVETVRLAQRGLLEPD